MPPNKPYVPTGLLDATEARARLMAAVMTDPTVYAVFRLRRLLDWSEADGLAVLAASLLASLTECREALIDTLASRSTLSHAGAAALVDDYVRMLNRSMTPPFNLDELQQAFAASQFDKPV